MALESNVTADDNVFLNEDKDLIFQIYQSDAETAQNITGWSLSWFLKKFPTDPDASAKLAKTNGSPTDIEMTNPAVGICTVVLLDTDTASLPAGIYHHELKRVDAGFATVLSAGTFMLKRTLHIT